MSIRGFEGQSTQYRQLRAELLRAEIALKDQREQVAELRRRLPLGAPVPTDYAFREVMGGLRPGSRGSTREVRLSELFGIGKDHLIVVHTMWAEANERPCPMCNMWAAGYDAVAPFVSDRTNFVLVVKQDVEKLRAWARERSWHRIRLLSSQGTSFNRDYGVQDESGEQKPGVSVFTRTNDGTIRHFYTTEASLAPGHHRGIDLFTPVWNLFDLLPDGRGEWMPRHAYDDLEINLELRAPSMRVYEAVATQEGVRRWWTELCEMDGRVGGRASFRFPRNGFYALVEITALEPGVRVEWRCIDSQHPAEHGFADLKDWIGTTIRFAVSPIDNERSRLRFAHVGLGPLECAGVCTSAWSFFLGTSLRGLVERGRGEPYVERI